MTIHISEVIHSFFDTYIYKKNFQRMRYKNYIKLLNNFCSKKTILMNDLKSIDIKF